MSKKGIVCPKCGSSKLRAVTTTKPLSGLVVRYRKCQCGQRITTEERVRKKKLAKC